MLFLLDAPSATDEETGETKTVSLSVFKDKSKWPNGECRVERTPDEHDIACDREGFNYLYHGKIRLRNGKPRFHVTTDNGDTILYDSWNELVKAGWVLEGTL